MFNERLITKKNGRSGKGDINLILHIKTGSRGKTHYAAGELVFGVNNPAVFLRKILGLFSMAKRQNSSMQHNVFSCSARFYVIFS